MTTGHVGHSPDFKADRSPIPGFPSPAKLASLSELAEKINRGTDGPNLTGLPAIEAIKLGLQHGLQLEEVAKRALADEREACAAVVDRLAAETPSGSIRKVLENAARAIRARKP